MPAIVHHAERGGTGKKAIPRTVFAGYNWSP